MPPFQYRGPDYRAVAMANYLVGLIDARESFTSVPTDVYDAVMSVRRDQANYLQHAKSQYEAADAKAAVRKALLDSDVTLPKGELMGERCDVVAQPRGREFRGHPCPNRATVRRTWTTSEFIGNFLDGQRLDNGWHVVAQSPNPYTPNATISREMTPDEQARVERRSGQYTHTINLCGTHRNQPGQFGMPF